MPGSSSNSSFIPKRGTSKRSNKARSTKLLSLTVVAYVLLFASLLASAVVFFFDQSAKQQLEGEVIAFNDAVSSFKEADLRRVQEFDIRLQQANQRIENSASVLTLLEAIEDVTIRTVTFNNLDLLRNFDDNFLIDVQIDTDTFDSSIFQREIFAAAAAIEAIEITDISIEGSSSEEGAPEEENFALSASLAVPVSAVPYVGTAATAEPVVVPETVEEEVPAPEDENEETTDTANNETAL